MIIFLSKDTLWGREAEKLVQSFFLGECACFLGISGDPLPDLLKVKKNYVILSFLSPWIVPKAVLDKADLALNFHPGSTDYPGIGCYNFALYEGAKCFGVVCHHMAPQVDRGAVVEERLFEILPHESVETLKLRSMVELLSMFHGILGKINASTPLPKSDAQWTRKPFTRKQLDQLCEIAPEMDEAEVRRRVRATAYPGYPGAAENVPGAAESAARPDREPFA